MMAESSKLEDLLALAKSSDLLTLTRIMCVFGMTLDDQKAKRCRLQEAQKRLARIIHESQTRSWDSLPNVL